MSNKYTVVVRYPDRLASGAEPMHYVAYVKAGNLLTAIDIGRSEAHRAQPPKDRGRLIDWEEILTFSGHPRLEHLA